MAKIITCPSCGFTFVESGWEKVGRYGIYAVEGTIKWGSQLAIAILTQGRSSMISNMAGKAGEAITGDPSKLTWGDLVCPNCEKKIMKIKKK